MFIDFPSLWKRRWRLCSKVAPAIGAEMAVQIVQPSLYQCSVPALVSASVLFLFERMVPLPRPKSGTSCPQAVTAARNIAQRQHCADALIPRGQFWAVDTCVAPPQMCKFFIYSLKKLVDDIGTDKHWKSW